MIWQLISLLTFLFHLVDQVELAFCAGNVPGWNWMQMELVPSKPGSYPLGGPASIDSSYVERSRLLSGGWQEVAEH